MHEIRARYPGFTNAGLFENLCVQLESQGNLQQNVNLSLKRYQNSVIHKLTSAIYSLKEIRNIIQTGSYLPGLTSTGVTTVQGEFDDVFKISYYQDSFFSSLISSFDILSLKLNLIYSNPISNIRNCYFSSLVNALFQSHPNGVVERFLDVVRNSPWYNDTCPFRTCLTHRQQPDYTVNIDVVAGSPTIRHYLPDDPLIVPCTYVNQTEIITFCQDKEEHFINAINDIDGLLIRETNRIGHIPF